jgi:hypothetical protein
MPRTAGIAVHQPERGSDQRIADRAEQTSCERAGCFQIRAHNLDEHELSELRRCETGPRQFSCPLANKLVEQPVQDRRLRRSGLNVDQRRQDIRQQPSLLTTILPGAVFGPVLSADNVGSAQVIGRLLQGRMPGIPRLAFEVVDVRDLADVHIRAMTSEQAAGERFIAVSEFMWMTDIAQTLRTKLGRLASKVPTRRLPDFVLRFLALFDPEIRAIAPGLGRKNRHTSEKAQRLLAWRPRPAAVTVVDCAESLMTRNAV